MKGMLVKAATSHWEDDTLFTLSLLLLPMHIYVSLSEHLPPMKENEPVVLRPTGKQDHWKSLLRESQTMIAHLYGVGCSYAFQPRGLLPAYLLTVDFDAPPLRTIVQAEVDTRCTRPTVKQQESLSSAPRMVAFANQAEWGSRLVRLARPHRGFSARSSCYTVHTGEVLCAPPMLVYLSSRQIGHNPKPSTTASVGETDMLTIDRVTQKSIKRTLMRFFGHNQLDTPISVYDPKAYTSSDSSGINFRKVESAVVIDRQPLGDFDATQAIFNVRPSPGDDTRQEGTFSSPEIWHVK
ncbi:hypothetical protein C8Q74DRAFT_1222566 [Fomes fomentarius]|nr:hypothetical protein C8Q74DRAFT_1222566 [Fomes fomentarius]